MCHTVYPYIRKMGDQEETQVKTVVTPARNTETVYDGELSPTLNDSGNIQDAQPQPPPGSHDFYESNSENEVHITVYTHSGTHDFSEEEEEEDPFFYGDADANATIIDSPKGTTYLTILMLPWMVLQKNYLSPRYCSKLVRLKIWCHDIAQNLL